MVVEEVAGAVVTELQVDGGTDQSASAPQVDGGADENATTPRVEGRTDQPARPLQTLLDDAEVSSVSELLLDEGEFFRNSKGKARPMPRPLAPLADTHGHLTSFHENDPAVVLARAALAGLRMLVVPVDPTDDGRDPEAFLANLDRWRQEAAMLLDAAAAEGQLVPEFPGYQGVPALLDNVRIVAGVHPYGAADLDDDAWERLGRLLESPRCAGVGEIGLDYTCDVPEDVQRDAFARQLRLAIERGLPVELHIRDERDDPEALAHRDALDVLDEVGLPPAGVDLHCYTDDPAVMAPYVARGCHVAFGGALTFKRSDEIRDAACACPEQLLLSETDCPYMAPVPLRGTEGEPAMVAYTAAALAELREECGLALPRETYRALWRNACELLGA